MDAHDRVQAKAAFAARTGIRSSVQHRHAHDMGLHRARSWSLTAALRWERVVGGLEQVALLRAKGIPDAHSSTVDRDFRMAVVKGMTGDCLLYTSPSPRDRTRSRMPSSA